MASRFTTLFASSFARVTGHRSARGFANDPNNVAFLLDGKQWIVLWNAPEEGWRRLPGRFATTADGRREVERIVHGLIVIEQLYLLVGEWQSRGLIGMEDGYVVSSNLNAEFDRLLGDRV